MTTRLLTILGTGPRHRVSYELDGSPLPPTASIDAALVRHFDVRDVVILGTTEAIDKAGDARQTLGEGAWPETVAVPEPTAIADGRGTAEFWAVFGAVRTAYGQLCDRSDAERDVVLVNLTHGFRTQPMIAQAAVLFEAAERRRRGSPVVSTRLLYGAIFLPQRSSSEQAPPADELLRGAIWDMTSILEASDWSTAIAALRDHARAEPIEQQLKALDARLRAGGGQSSRSTNFKALGQVTRELADMLVTGRTAQLAAFPRRFLDLWRDVRPTLERALPPIVDAIDGFAAEVARFKTTSVVSDEGVAAAFSAVDWLIRTGQYAAATALMRETAVTREAVAVGEPAGHEPGTNFKSHERGRVERRLNRQALRDNSTWDQVAQLRNDLLHAGYRQDPKANGEEIRRHCVRLLGELTASPAAGAPASAKNRAVVINLTSRPHASWEEPERTAALELGASIEDVPLPTVPEDGDASGVYKLAELLVAALETKKLGAVIVQGEPTISTTLVQLLQEVKVSCYAPVVSVTGSFVQFRQYPSLRR